MNKRMLIVVASLALLLMATPFVSACGTEAAQTATVTVTKTISPTAAKPEYEFYFIGHTFPLPWWSKMEKGALDVVNHYNVKVNWVWFDKFSLEDQADRVDEIIALKPDGIAITIPDATIMDGPARRAIAAGIPVIAVNNADPRPEAERIPYLFYIGPNDRLMGQQAAKEMLKVRTPKRVGIGILQAGSLAQEERAAGVEDVMKPLGVTVDKVITTMDPTKIKERMRAYFVATPEADGWFTMADDALSTALDLFRETGKTNDIMLVHIEVNEMALKAIKTGEVIAAFDQQVYLQGYLPFEWLYLYNKWGYLPSNDILTGPAVINKSNVDKMLKLFASGDRF